MLSTLGRLCAPETGLDKPQNPHVGGACLVHLLPALGFPMTGLRAM